jgi:hypothetical protein
MPVEYVRESVELASQFGLPKDEVAYVTDYLLDRRTRLRELFRDNKRSVFPKVWDGLLDPFMDNNVEYCI